MISVTNHILQRVFQIRANPNSSGSCFTIDYDGKQYICTAKHLLDGKKQDHIEIRHDGGWKCLKVTVVGFGADASDIVVLSPAKQLSASTRIGYGWTNMNYGTEMRILGFPLGLSIADDGNLNRAFPFPLVKGAILSGFAMDVPRRLFLDCYNNPGFSGGPVVHVPSNSRGGRDLEVAGVISAYQASRVPIVREADNASTELYIRENAGIAIAHSIEYAMEVIRSNPIGVKLDG